MIFVVGTGRCGTVSFNKLLNECGLESYHELIFNNEANARDLWTESVKYCSIYPISDVCRRWAEPWLRRMLKQIPDAAHVNHHFSRIILLLHEMFPAARFVWLIRDARPCVASMARAPMWYNNDAPWERWNIRGHWIDPSITREGWRSLTKVGQCAWNYKWENDLIGESLHADAPMKWAVADSGVWAHIDQMRQIVEWLGAPRRPVEVPHENKAVVERRKWTDQVEAECQRFCGNGEAP